MGYDISSLSGSIPETVYASTTDRYKVATNLQYDHSAETKALVDKMYILVH